MAIYPATMKLLEREAELEEVERLMSAARRGDGATLIIEGSAGIGKSALIRAIRDRAVRASLSVLAARGAEFESDFSFGVARQLLEPAVAAAEDEEREALMSGAARHAEPAVERSAGCRCRRRRARCRA
jgi:predicted ATPase